MESKLKALAVNTEDLSSVPGIHRVEDQCPLNSHTRHATHTVHMYTTQEYIIPVIIDQNET